MSLPFDSASQIAAIGTQNPQTTEQSYFSLGNVTEEDQKTLVDTITTYCNQWSTDRMERMRVWMKNVLMYKGMQVLQWDTTTNTWFDALAWYRQNKAEDGEQVELDRWVNNITLMLGQAFVGQMSRGVPQTVVRPENANVLADVTTARAATEAIGIIERRNQSRQMVRTEFEHHYLFGCYFKRTDAVLDGEWSGYDDEPVYGMQEINLPARLQCGSCGRETPVQDVGPTPSCPNCQTRLTPATYLPSEQRQQVGVIGTRRVPRAMVRQTIHSPLEVTVDPSVKYIHQTPLLKLEQEVDIGEMRLMLPAMREKILEGAVSSTSENADYERLRRSEVNSALVGTSADSSDQRPTYSQVWMRPTTYYRMGNYDFGDRMLQQFPEGLRLTMCGAEVVDIRPAVLTKVWTHCRLHESMGLYGPSIAERVVPFNERFNSTMQILDDWAQRAATGINVVDGSRIDSERWHNRSMAAGMLTEIPMKLGAERVPIDEAFRHYDLPLNPALWNYPQMLVTFCQLIAGMPPQTVGGGTQEGVDTFGGQKQMLAQASTAMQPFWENVKEEHALAAQNAIECLQKLMKVGAVQEINDVVQSMGSAFVNNYVNFEMMRGRVKVYPDEDQGMPQTPEDLRATYTSILQEVAKNNTAAQAIFDVPENQEQILLTLAPDLTQPEEAQREKTLQDINALLEQGGQPVQNPDGSIGQSLPVEPDKREQFPAAKKTLQNFMLENCELRTTNPQGWARLHAYFDMLDELDMASGKDQAQRNAAVQQAGQPPRPPEQQQQMQATQLLLQDASVAIQQLVQMAGLPPLPKGTSIAGQVAAAKEILDTALKAQQALAS